MGSPQTLSLEGRRAVAIWAATCAARVLPIFENANPGDARPREAIVRARAFARGELDTARLIVERFQNGGAARGAGLAAAAAARAAGQAAAIPHMGAHALGASGYAVKAAVLSSGDSAGVLEHEVRWQLQQLAPDARDALSLLPPLGEDRSGPLGPGLLARGLVGDAIRMVQAGLGATPPSRRVE